MTQPQRQLDSRIEIVTPENIAFHYVLAGPFRRLPAYLIDCGICVGKCPETAIVAASDVPFTRWAGQELAALARQLTPTSIKGASLAVELEPGVGIEILWDQPCHTAPIPWEATEGGWSWRVHYDPDEPTPLAEWPSPIPALVTVGTRGHRQLLVDLEAVATLAVSGPTADVDAWIRAVVLELGAGDDLADASVLTVGSGVDGVEHLERVAHVHPNEAIGLLTARAHDVTNLLDEHVSLFHRRLGENPVLGLSTDVVVCGDIELETQTQIAACVVPRHGAAVILTADIEHAGARLVLDGYGSAVLHGIGTDPILITPVGVPKRFDTHFLMVAAPADQLGAADGSESVDGLWISPARAIADGDAGRRTLVPATRMNLKKITPFGTVAEAMTVTRASKVVTVLPEVERRPDGRVVKIPIEAGYGISEYFVASGQPTASGKA